MPSVRLSHLMGLALLTVVAGFAILSSASRLLAIYGGPSREPAAATGGVPALSWPMLRQYNYSSRIASSELAAFEGKRVRVPGFMIPLEDDLAATPEFLLVPYAGACVHTPPLPPNQIVKVQMIRNRPVPVDMQVPIWLTGELYIGNTATEYGEAGFVMVGLQVESYGVGR